MIDWTKATLKKSQLLTKEVKSLFFDLPNFPTHKAGQHINIKVTTPDGYHAERDYSLANPPEQKDLELGIELIPDGEVSPLLFNLTEGDQIEIRGPIGAELTWDSSMPGPLILIGAGSGLVPSD
jgi:ferredoxin-NADP reductase